MNWYKTAKIGEVYLNAKGVPTENIDEIAGFLHSLPDKIQNLLMKKHIIPKPEITVKELQEIVEKLKIGESPKLAPQTMQLVNETSQDKKEREWIANQIINKKLNPKEDMPKTRRALLDLNRVGKKSIEEFTDFPELSKYLQEFRINENKKIELPKDGWSLLENIGDLQLYKITNQEALDAIGGSGSGNADWCVLSKNGKYEYGEFQYWCFVIDGEPRVLIHPSSGQIKDETDDVLTDRLLVGQVAPYIEKYRFEELIEEASEEASEETETNQEEFFEDFGEYKEALKYMKKIKENAHLEDFVEGSIRKDLKNITALDEKDIGKYVHILADSINEIKMGYGGFNLPKRAIDLLVNYLQVNGMDGKLDMLKEEVKKHIATNNIETGRYKKIVPESLQTKEIGQYFTKIKNDESFKEKEDVVYGLFGFGVEGKNFSKEDWERFFIINQTKRARASELDEKIPKDIYNEISGSPEVWKKIVLKSPNIFPKKINIDDDPEVKAARISNLKNSFIRSPYYFNSRANFYPQDLTNEVLNDKQTLRQAAFQYPEDIKKISEYITFDEKTEEEDSNYLFDKINIEHDGVLKNYLESYWGELLEKNPREIGNCPLEKFSKDPNMWKKGILKNRFLAEDCPLMEVHEDPEFWKTFLLSGGQQNMIEYNNSNKIKGNPEFRKEILLSDKSISSWDRIDERKYPEKLDPDVQEKMIEKIREKVQSDPKYYNIVPQFAQEDPEVIKAYYLAWRKDIMGESEFNSSLFKRMPITAQELFDGDQELKNNLIPKWKKKALSLSEVGFNLSQSNLPHFLRTSPFREEALADNDFIKNLIDKHGKHAIYLDEYNPTLQRMIALNSPGDIPHPILGNKGVMDDPEVSQARLSHWRSKIIEDPSKHENCPEEILEKLLEDDQVKSIIFNLRKKWITENPQVNVNKAWGTINPLISEIDSQIKEIPEIKQIIYNSWKEAVIKNPYVIHSISISDQKLKSSLMSDHQVKAALARESFEELKKALIYSTRNFEYVASGIGDELMSKIKASNEGALLFEEYNKRKKKEESQNARLNSSAFNDNYIGKLS